MKTKLTRISKRALAMVLCFLMMLSIMFVGTVTAGAKSWVVGEYIYIKNFKPSGWSDNWITSGGTAWAHLWIEGVGKEIDIQFSQYSGDYYRARITTAANYDRVIFTRNKSNSTGPWNETWNQTGDIVLDATHNCYTSFTASGTSKSVSYYAVKPDSVTASVTDAKSGTGTSSNPYIVDTGATYTVKLTGTKDDAGMTGFGWNIDSSSSKASSTTTNTYTKTFTASSTNGTVASHTGYAWNYKSSTSYYSSSHATSNTIYIKSVSPGHDVTISAGTGGSVSPSGKQAVGSSGISVKATPNAGYHFKDWTVTGGASVTDANSATTTLHANATGTLTANFEKDEPACTSVTLTREPSGTVYKDVEYTFTATAEGAVSGATYHFYVDGSTKQNTVSNEFKTSFADTNTHTVYVQVEKSGYTSVKSDTLSLTPSESQSESSKDVTYYIDLHDNKISTSPTIKFGSGAATTLTKVGESTVYSAKVSTPYKYDAVSGDVDTPIADIPATVTCNGGEYQVTIGKKAISTGEAWLESIGQIKRDKVTTSTTTTSKVSKTKKVVYLVVSTSLSGWTTPHLYCDDGTMDWTSAKAMTKIGTNTSGQSVYAVEVGVSATVGVFKTVAGSADDINNRSVDANLSSSNRFLISTSTSNDNNGNYGRTLTSYSSTEAFVYSHPSTITISSDSSTNISMTKDDDYTGASITYSVPSTYSSIISVSGSTLTAKSVTTRKTATITGTVHSGYYSSMSSWTNKTYDEKTFTINVTVEPEVTSGSFNVMSYKSVSSTFDAENGTLSGVSTELHGSKSTGNATSTINNRGIVTKNSSGSYTVKYAEADSDTEYGTLKLKVTPSTTALEDYYFDGWYVGDEKSVDYKDEYAEIWLDGKDYTIKYIQRTTWTVNIVYKYDLYDDSEITYYDEDYAKEHDIPKEYSFEGITFVGDNLSDEETSEYIIHNHPTLVNDYYEYHLVSDPKTQDPEFGYEVQSDDASKTYTITAYLKKTVRTYTVNLNGAVYKQNLTYQAPVTIESGEVSGVGNSENLIWYDDGKQVATGTSYNFRITGDMSITTAANTDGITLNGKTIIAHRSHDVNTAMKEIVQNFYIADFYNDSLGKDVEFVGGGALYYAMNDETGAPTKAKDAVDASGVGINEELTKVVERSGGENDYVDDVDNVTDANTNVVCRYLNYDEHKDVFRYSDALQAYQYIYSPRFLNDEKYSNYSLRVYSFFVYYDQNNGEYTVSVSDDYADAKLYAEN